MSVRPDGFAGVAIPLAVHGTELVWPNGAGALTGPVNTLAGAAGVDAGPPDGVYEIVDPLPTDAVFAIDAGAVDWIHRSHYAGGHAIKNVLPDQHPVLWPEHFDVAAAEDEVNYGVSAGDDYYPTPYAYVGPWTQRTGPFWNAPFGCTRSIPHTMSTRSPRTSPISWNPAERNCDGGIQQRLQPIPKTVERLP
jgi:hypothetical protein